MKIPQELYKQLVEYFDYPIGIPIDCECKAERPIGRCEYCSALKMMHNLYLIDMPAFEDASYYALGFYLERWREHGIVRS